MPTVRAGRSFIVASLSSLVFVLFPSPAHANNFGWGCIDEGGSGCVQYYYNHGSSIRYFYENLDQSWQDNLSWNRVNNLNPTDLSTSYVSEHSNSDVAVRVNNYGDLGWAGQADCVDRSAPTCRHWHLEMNTYYGPYTQWQKRYLACHESGHSVGLRHVGAAGCVEETWSTNLFSGHDVDHINAYY